MKKVAVLIDGGYLSKIYKRQLSKNLTPGVILKLVEEKILQRPHEELFRLYYYDAPPFGKEITNPIDNSTTDFSKTPLFTAVNDFHRELAETDFVALRKGKLSFGGWKLTRGAINNIKKTGAIEPSDITPDFKQKAVDMKIGLDIAWLATKKIVEIIALVTADNDFIPAMKFARKEGIHITIAKIDSLNTYMRQHADKIIDIDIKTLEL
ncbi:MAG: NYN domain-containing protein [Candidatus Brocadiales bacterium]|nr:NYN domain-containing protein [Candidatus Bathyanammoxibius amoris]